MGVILELLSVPAAVQSGRKPCSQSEYHSLQSFKVKHILHGQHYVFFFRHHVHDSLKSNFETTVDVIHLSIK